MLAALRTRTLGWIRPRGPEMLPIALHRRRIYILPTGFGMFCGVLMGTMLLGALNYNNNPALLLGFLLAATAHLSLHATNMSLSGIRLLDARALPVHVGDPLPLELRFDALRARPRNGLVLALEDASAVFALPAADVVQVELALPTSVRGWLRTGRLKISTTQPLGLSRAWGYFWPELKLLVYPALEAHAPPLPTHEGMGARSRVRSQGEEPHHLRDYHVGDPPRQVAWKASARMGKLLVREYETRTDLDLRLDWDALSSLPLETRISRLARWVVEADRLNSRYLLVLPGQSLGPAQGHAHRHACLQALALMPHG
ncbi:MAG TPA: DUF58 domain-containing protein [Xanthomonadaceae bacterium]|jgi:uncharacterized protein (DUF58 family)